MVLDNISSALLQDSLLEYSFSFLENPKYYPDLGLKKRGRYEFKTSQQKHHGQQVS